MRVRAGVRVAGRSCWRGWARGGRGRCADLLAFGGEGDDWVGEGTETAPVWIGRSPVVSGSDGGAAPTSTRNPEAPGVRGGGWERKSMNFLEFLLRKTVRLGHVLLKAVNINVKMSSFKTLEN